MEILSETKLENKINIIKKCLYEIDVKNIVFLSPEIFYDSVTNSLSNKSIDFGALINDITPYIPLVITDSNLELFLEAVMENDDELVCALEENFVKNSAARFITLIYNADENELKKLIDACEEIRKFKEEELYAV